MTLVLLTLSKTIETNALRAVNTEEVELLSVQRAKDRDSTSRNRGHSSNEVLRNVQHHLVLGLAGLNGGVVAGSVVVDLVLQQLREFQTLLSFRDSLSGTGTLGQVEPLELHIDFLGLTN